MSIRFSILAVIAAISFSTASRADDMTPGKVAPRADKPTTCAFILDGIKAIDGKIARLNEIVEFTAAEKEEAIKKLCKKREAGSALHVKEGCEGALPPLPRQCRGE